MDNREAAATGSAGLGLPEAGELLASKYRIERCIGRGGMGAVFLAHHELLDQRVAIKLLLPEILSDGSAVARFVNEARAAARIHNQHVAQVLDVDTLPGGGAFMVLEYLQGSDLASLLAARGPLPVPEATAYVLQALEALALAHAQGIVHRDLKPANLFLADTPSGPIIKVLDFGISKAAGPRLTAVNQLLGSPAFMSPEQVRSSRDVDVRSDLWSTGVVLYQLVSGQLPFPGESANEVFKGILEVTPPPPSYFNAAVPPGFDAVIATCLQRDRTQRVQTTADLAEALLPFTPPSERGALERIRLALGGSRPIPLVAAPAASDAFGVVTPHAPARDAGLVSRTFRRPAADSQQAAPDEEAPFPKTVSRDRLPVAAPLTPERHDTPREPPPARRRGPLLAAAAAGALVLLAGLAYLALRPSPADLGAPPDPGSSLEAHAPPQVPPPAGEGRAVETKGPARPPKPPSRPPKRNPVPQEPPDEASILDNRK